MADHFALESLQGSADGLVDVVERMTTALRELESKLQGFGSPWGTGVVGTLIGELYQGIHDMALGSYETNGEVMSEYAVGLGTLADTLDAFEEQIKEGVVNLTQDLVQLFGGEAGPP